MISRKFIIIFYAVLAMSWSQNSIAYETYRYKVDADDARLIIYPSNVTLTLHQKHAVLYKIAMEMKAGSSQDLAEFIQISLREMALLYEEIATRKDEKPDDSITDNKRNWRKETIKVANELYAAADRVDPGRNLDVSMDDTGELLITVDDEIYILSNPVINKPYLLDRRIIDTVCISRYCDPEKIRDQEVTASRDIVIRAGWIISEGNKPVFATDDGLYFVFADLAHRSEKQISSLKVIREICMIVDLLDEASKKGISLDWDKVSIKKLYGSYDYRIQLNDFGDSIYAKLPELDHVPDWRDKVSPWIRARLEDRQVDHYLDGDALLAYALQRAR